MFAWLYNERFARKAQTGMQRTAEKPNQNGDAKNARKQDGFQKLLQAK